MMDPTIVKIEVRNVETVPSKVAIKLVSPTMGPPFFYLSSPPPEDDETTKSKTNTTTNPIGNNAVTQLDIMKLKNVVASSRMNERTVTTDSII